MYLVDTNIFLESLLGQNRSNEVQSFLQSVDLSNIYITNFALHSIGIILFRLKNIKLFNTFLEDVVLDGIRVLELNTEELKTLDELYQKYNLDFDDAYQYVVAKKYNLQLVSFDTDYDRTDIKRWEPADILKRLSSHL